MVDSLFLACVMLFVAVASLIYSLSDRDVPDQSRPDSRNNDAPETTHVLTYPGR